MNVSSVNSFSLYLNLSPSFDAAYVLHRRREKTTEAVFAIMIFIALQCFPSMLCQVLCGGLLLLSVVHVTEWARLEETFKIITSNHQPDQVPSLARVPLCHIKCCHITEFCKAFLQFFEVFIAVTMNALLTELSIVFSCLVMAIFNITDPCGTCSIRESKRVAYTFLVNMQSTEADLWEVGFLISEWHRWGKHLSYSWKC